MPGSSSSSWAQGAGGAIWLTPVAEREDVELIVGRVPWPQATQAKDYPIISTADSSRTVSRARAMIFSMRPVAVYHRRWSRFGVAFAGGPGIAGNGERRLPRRETGSSRIFWI